MFCCVIICSLWKRKVSPALVICVYIWRAVWKVCTGVWCPVKPVLVFGTEGQETFWSHLGSLPQGRAQSSGVGRNQWSVGGHIENEVGLHSVCHRIRLHLWWRGALRTRFLVSTSASHLTSATTALVLLYTGIWFIWRSLVNIINRQRRRHSAHTALPYIRTYSSYSGQRCQHTTQLWDWPWLQEDRVRMPPTIHSTFKKKKKKNSLKRRAATCLEMNWTDVKSTGDRGRRLRRWTDFLGPPTAMWRVKSLTETKKINPCLTTIKY